jgi:hypothetical protein
MDSVNVVPDSSVIISNSTLNSVGRDQINNFNNFRGEQPIRLLCSVYGDNVFSRRIAEDPRREVDLWPDPGPNHQDACKKRQPPTTGAWFVERDAYNQWKQDPEPSLFWLYGKRMRLGLESLPEFSV